MLPRINITGGSGGPDYAPRCKSNSSVTTALFLVLYSGMMYAKSSERVRSLLSILVISASKIVKSFRS